jgi:membrane protease subunit HflK
MAEQSQRASTTGELKIDSSTFRELTNAVTEQLRRDAAAADSRRGVR